MDNNKNNRYNKSNKNINKIVSKFSKQKELMRKPVSSKRLVYGICTLLIILLLLSLRIANIQFIQGSNLKELASRQQTTNRIISPNRGIIYDSTGKVLAQSASVDTITINPSKIKNNVKNIQDKAERENEIKKLQEKVAKAFSEIFELDYDEVFSKVTSSSSIETIIRKVEQEPVDKLKKWMEENEVSSGINIDPDVKRYYPYGTLASNLIGFCDIDNNGQEGLELKWNNVLSGTAGKIVTIENAASGLIPDKNETYIAAENGSNLTLTIDANVQTIVEKYLKQACIENNCKYGGTAIIMRPSNGDILAMATYPDYDLNNPRVPEASLLDTWETLSSSEQVNHLSKMWRNKCIADGYEPGSTFKIITASIGLEEGICQTDTKNDFLCVGHEIVNGLKINCWKYETTHGYQTLRQSLMNSCNPAMMQLGKRIGSSTLYKYYKAFGLFDKTGIATSGESNSLFWDLDNVGNIELATMSFGQRFRVTPIQLITAVSSIANNGTLMQPRIVKNLENADTGTVTSLEPTSVRKVLSSETCSKVLDMLTSVVSDGTGYLGAVKGYTIAGKTGTSEPDKTGTNPMYVASFIGIAPSKNPELVTLVTLYGPEGPKGHQGGTIAAPVVSQILSEVLPYLEIPADELTSSSSSKITLPDVRNKTVNEAQKTLEGLGLSAIISGSDPSSLVTDQVPKPGTSLIEGSSVNIYSAGNEARISAVVPNLKDMTLTQAKSALKSKHLNINATGSGKVVSQTPMAGTTVEEGTVINVTLQQHITEAH